MLRKWTDADVALLKEMMQNRCSRSEIAAALSRTEKAVEHKKSALRHPEPKTSQNTSTKKIRLTPREEKWLTNHYKHTRNIECAERLGISLRTVVRIARALGLSKSRQFILKCQRETAAAAKQSHLRNGTYPPKGFRIPKSDVGQFKPGVTSRERLGAKREAERIRKSAESRRATVSKERARIVWGFDQRTKLKLTTNPKKIQYRYALRKRGYQIERGGSEAYIVAGTNRSPKVEAIARKHGIRVIE